MSLWKLTARRKNGFCLELGIYDFGRIDRHVVSDRIILTNIEQDANFGIVSIQFLRMEPCQKTKRKLRS
jgi:hypothetical protein